MIVLHTFLLEIYCILHDNFAILQYRIIIHMNVSIMFDSHEKTRAKTWKFNSKSILIIIKATIFIEINFFAFANINEPFCSCSMIPITYSSNLQRLKFEYLLKARDFIIWKADFCVKIPPTIIMLHEHCWGNKNNFLSTNLVSVAPEQIVIYLMQLSFSNKNHSVREGNAF